MEKSWFLLCDICRIKAVLKAETDIITGIVARVIGWADDICRDLQN